MNIHRRFSLGHLSRGTLILAALTVATRLEGQCFSQNYCLDAAVSAITPWPSGVLLPTMCGQHVEFEMGSTSTCGNGLCVDGVPVAYVQDGVDRENSVTDVGASAGISGIRTPGKLPLLGLFLGPAGTVTPPTLDFTLIGTDFTDLHPLVNQVFFIGDGLTGTGSGSRQRFWTSEGADRIVVGFLESATAGGPPCCLADNRCVPFPAVLGLRSSYFSGGDAIGLVGTPGGGQARRASSIDNPRVDSTIAVAVLPIRWCNEMVGPPFGLQWRRNGVPLFDGRTSHGSVIEGANSATLFVLDAKLADEGMYDCIATSTCQQITSAAIPLVVCIGDFDATPGVTVNDLFLFLSVYFADDSRADVNESGALTVEDIFVFLRSFFGEPPC